MSTPDISRSTLPLDLSDSDDEADEDEEDGEEGSGEGEDEASEDEASERESGEEDESEGETGRHRPGDDENSVTDQCEGEEEVIIIRKRLMNSKERAARHRSRTEPVKVESDIEMPDLDKIPPVETPRKEAREKEVKKMTMMVQKA